MTAIDQLRARAIDARAHGALVLISPEVLDALLDVAQWPDEVGLDEEVIER